MKIKEAMHYTKLKGGRVRCGLCPHRCAIDDGGRGKCRVRENSGGTLVSLNYGRVTSTAMDPIEKKPLYHFHPSSPILSLGTLGCNFHCSFCQNYEISQLDVSTRELSPKDAVTLAKRNASDGIAYTYNEPIIWYEYVLDTASLARDAGLYNVLVSNGFINPEPFEELLAHVDAINMDLKSISDDFYKHLCGGRVAPVLESAKLAKERVHLEVTNLVIPGENDSDEDLAGLANWIADNLGADTPVHLSAYSPRYKLQREPTDGETLTRAFEIFNKRLTFVYIGNMYKKRGNNTQCKKCGNTLIERSGYSVRITGLNGASCAKCGMENNIKNQN
jgi:pyruvate formate lyase activating enzyme